MLLPEAIAGLKTMYLICTAVEANLAGAPAAFYEIQLVVLLYKQLHHTASHNVKLPRHVIHAVQVAVWAQVHLHTSWARREGHQHPSKVRHDRLLWQKVQVGSVEEGRQCLFT